MPLRRAGYVAGLFASLILMSPLLLGENKDCRLSPRFLFYLPVLGLALAGGGLRALRFVRTYTRLDPEEQERIESQDRRSLLAWALLAAAIYVMLFAAMLLSYLLGWYP